jgi:hypothetical protein
VSGSKDGVEGVESAVGDESRCGVEERAEGGAEDEEDVCGCCP